MKVALVLAGNLENSPYCRYYTDVLDNLNISYDIISWDRLSLGTEGDYCFKYYCPERTFFLKKILDYSNYSRFSKNILIDLKYDFVFIFAIANVVYLGSTLKNSYQKKYIIDIRDYSPLVPFMRIKLKGIIKNSRQVYISSPGWRKWLPDNFSYFVSHNVRIKDLEQKITATQIRDKRPLIISTFGSLRDYETNQKLINELNNHDKYILDFNGSGCAPLEDFARKKNSNNIRFGGRYSKNDESLIIKRADIINILFPRSIAHDGIMSNRFYQALIFKKPVLVNEGNIQAEFVKKYNLGLVLEKGKSIPESLNEYLIKFDIDLFEKGCNEMIHEIKIDMRFFENSLKELLT